MGEGWAKYLVLSGRIIRADEALRIGLVQAVFPEGRAHAQAMKLAEELAGKSPLAMRYCKAAVNAAADTDLATGQGIERDLFALASRARTRPRAWPRSSRSGRRSSAGAERGRRPEGPRRRPAPRRPTQRADRRARRDSTSWTPGVARTSTSAASTTGAASRP